MLSVDDLFREFIVLYVRWYLRYKLSFRDLVETMGERGLSSAQTTILRWVRRYGSCLVDETYVRIEVRWVYHYRAVDEAGKTVDFLLRAKQDVSVAKASFRRAISNQGCLPRKIRLNGYQASHREARELHTPHRGGARTGILSSKYPNNLIEQDQRSTKLRLGPMLGFKRFRRAAITVAGVELMHRIRKGQFTLSKFGAAGTTAPVIWSAVLAARSQRNLESHRAAIRKTNCTAATPWTLGVTGLIDRCTLIDPEEKHNARTRYLRLVRPRRGQEGGGILRR